MVSRLTMGNRIVIIEDDDAIADGLQVIFETVRVQTY